MKSLLHLILISVLIPVIAHAQDAFERFTFDTELEYNESIPSPEEFLGYPLGEEYSFHYQVMDYFHALDEASDKLTFHPYGTTYEGRTLYYAVITSEGNQGNIDQIKARAKEIAHNPEQASIEDHPVVVWLSYNVHGNEPSSSEAAMQTAYRLIAAEDEETASWLENAVVIIDPMINPDGRDRYVYWYKSSQANVLNTNPLDLEHDEPWPGGRTNHYWFDLNRDWVWLVHPESQGRIKVYQEWMPQVHNDYHEQGFNSNYFTMPGTTPRNHELPAAYEDWADVFGRGAVEAFDEANVNYATREAFDFFYPGYGSSYPSIMGGIGMLAEQGGHSRGGRSVETADGYLLTLRQRVFDHYKNSVSNVQVAAENRKALLEYFVFARSQAAQKGDTKAYILPNNPSDYTSKVVNLMMQHGVQVEQASQSFSQRNSYSYWDGQRTTLTFEEGDFIIKTDQPAHLFINTLMRRQLEIKDSVMYDMSTWSVPMAYNLDAAWTTSEISVATTPVNEPITHEGGVVQPDASYAFVVDWAQPNAPKALAKIWDLGYRVRAAEESFTLDGITYSPGSLVVLVGRNYEKKDQIAEDMTQVAALAGVTIHGLNTGRMDDGIDLGSRGMNPVHEPNVALMVDSPFSSYTAGQLWFLFDQWTEFGISRIRGGSFSASTLDDLDVILMPGAGGGLQSLFSDAQKEALKQWVQKGGVIIGTEGSAAWLTADQSGMTTVAMATMDEDEADESVDPVAYTRYEDREDVFGLRRIPGAAFKGVVDNSHPLAFGLPETLYSLKFGDAALVPNESFHTVGYYHKDPSQVLASGYASQESKEHAAGMAFAGVANVGQGKVVFLVDNTQYRMFWVGPSRMVQNAVMLLPGM